MQVSQILKKEQERLAEEFLNKLTIKSDTITFNDLLDRAIKNGLFNIDTYVFSNDEKYLYDLLNFSVGLSRLWTEYIARTNDSNYLSINKVIVTYMINMYGLEKIENRKEDPVELQNTEISSTE